MEGHAAAGGERILHIKFQEAQTAAHVGRQERPQRVRGGKFAGVVFERREHRLNLRDRRHNQAAAARHRHLMPQHRVRGVRVALRAHGLRRPARAERGVTLSPCVGGGHRHVRRDIFRVCDTRGKNGDKRHKNALLHTAHRPVSDINNRGK